MVSTLSTACKSLKHSKRSGKRGRAYSPEQYEILWKKFLQNPLPKSRDPNEYAIIAAEAGLIESQVRVWFQNTRSRSKNKSRARLTPVNEVSGLSHVSCNQPNVQPHSMPIPFSHLSSSALLNPTFPSFNTGSFLYNSHTVSHMPSTYPSLHGLDVPMGLSGSPNPYFDTGQNVPSVLVPDLSQSL
ncbi:hypothetical protein P9112_011676 [Eukaryota sp. TZLM1-RC]